MLSYEGRHPRTHKLAIQLATVAIEGRLKLVTQDDNAARKSRILRRLDDMASRIREPYKSGDWDEYFYDEGGLPK
jgi:hypothetical protein